jgi:hypothetical protein
LPRSRKPCQSTLETQKVKARDRGETIDGHATRRRSTDARAECWHVYYGDVHAGTIANGHDPRALRSLKCREGRAGRRLEVNDPTIQSEFFAVVPATFLKTPAAEPMPRARRFPQKRGLMMKYRDIEYTVLQGIDRGVWKWSASVTGVVIKGQAAIKSEAVTAAEKAIDRALAQDKLRVVRPRAPD